MHQGQVTEIKKIIGNPTIPPSSPAPHILCHRAATTKPPWGGGGGDDPPPPPATSFAQLLVRGRGSFFCLCNLNSNFPLMWSSDTKSAGKLIKGPSFIRPPPPPNPPLPLPHLLTHLIPSAPNFEETTVFFLCFAQRCPGLRAAEC